MNNNQIHFSTFFVVYNFKLIEEYKDQVEQGRFRWNRIAFVWNGWIKCTQNEIVQKQIGNGAHENFDGQNWEIEQFEKTQRVRNESFQFRFDVYFILYETIQYECVW